MREHHDGSRPSGFVQKGFCGLQVCAALLAALALWGCEDETPPPPPPSFVEGSAQLVCEADADGRVVLIGGQVQVSGSDLLSVEVELPGTPGALPLALEGTAQADVPQTWGFTFDPAKRLLCNAQLIATFTALDSRGERATQAVAAP